RLLGQHGSLMRHANFERKKAARQCCHAAQMREELFSSRCPLSPTRVLLGVYALCVRDPIGGFSSGEVSDDLPIAHVDDRDPRLLAERLKHVAACGNGGDALWRRLRKGEPSELLVA